MNYIKIIACTLCCVLSLYGCQSKYLTVHKIDVQQGNALDAESVGKITLGMTKEQVHFVLGNPLIADSFHPERWDYIFLFKPGYGEEQRRQLTLIFDRGEIIDIIKHNIVADDKSSAEQDAKQDNDEKQLKSKKDAADKKEQEDLEKQAEELEQVLEPGKDPTN